MQTACHEVYDYFYLGRNVIVYPRLWKIYLANRYRLIMMLEEIDERTICFSIFLNRIPCVTD